MSATLFTILLFFKVSLLPLGASLSPAVDPLCPHNTIISEAEEGANITTIPHILEYKKTTALYLHPDPGFQGVTVVAAGNGWVHHAWFMLDNTCFPQDADWWEFVAGVLYIPPHLVYAVNTGDCYHVCVMSDSHSFDGVNLDVVVAHGPSRWRSTELDPCTAIPIKDGPLKFERCTTPPAPKTTTTNNNISTTSLSPTLDQRCPADTIISGAEKQGNITTVQTWGHFFEKELYVRPDPWFKGVSLVAEGDGWRSEAWFTFDNTCFLQDDAAWFILEAGVRSEWTDNGFILDFFVKTGECHFQCLREGNFTGDMNVSLQAQGPSRWRLQDPVTCSLANLTTATVSKVDCTKPTASKTTTTTTPTETVMFLGILAVIVVLSLLGVEVVA